MSKIILAKWQTAKWQIRLRLVGDVTNGDMRPRRAPGMPKIKRVKNHALVHLRYNDNRDLIFYTQMI